MLKKLGIRIIVYGGLLLPILLYTMQPLVSVNFKEGWPKGDPQRLRHHVDTLLAFGPRDARHPDVMLQVESWLEHELQAAGGRVSRQAFKVKGQTHQNIISRFGPDEGSRIVIGAHFDAYHGLPGADDNGSGVAVLLELARLLGERPPNTPVELVAWNLEEPPYFRTDAMGSRMHAKSLRNSGADIQYVVSLETLGTYSDEPDSQKYPLPGMNLLYPSRGNFLAVVSNYGNGWLVRTVKSRMQAATQLSIWSFNAPAWLVGIDFSDHSSYWLEGYPAFMITGTAFYRNPRYHKAEDTADQLDYERLASVVQAVHAMIL